jgi:hypothetical protein
VDTLGDKVTASVTNLSAVLVVTRSHRGHIDSVEAGSGSQL